MILYHGTSTKKLASIERNGLQPRWKRRKDAGWKEYPSASDRVYLTDCYAFFFSFNAAETFGGDPIVLEVEILDDHKKLVADEDALAQSYCDPMPWVNELDLETRTNFWKENAPRFPELAIPSLEALGTCAFMGTIPWKKDKAWGITKYVEVPDEFAWRFDPSISLLNHKYMGSRYHKALKQFVDADGKDMTVSLQTEQEIDDFRYLADVINKKGEKYYVSESS